MPKDNFIIIDQFRQGWHRRVDPSRVPLGGSIKSVNIQLTSRGGIAPRPGETLLGANNTTAAGVKSLYSLKKSDGTNILVKSYSTKLEYYNNKATAWSLLKGGYTSGQVFGFKEHNINVDAVDLSYFCNAVEPYSRWEGYEATLDGALAGAETAVIVDTTLIPDVYYSGTASATTTTTVTIATADWATDIWNDFYVRITSGAKNGFISKISATTSTQITFTAISGLSGTPTFEIRRLAVPATGTLSYNDQTVAYTAVPQDDRFTVGSAHAGADGAAVTVMPTEYPENPRGNILEAHLDSMLVAGEKSKPSTLSRSALADATDFTFSSPRSAQEGDVLYFPYGGKAITDVKAQEDAAYIIKEDSIESLRYTQDGSDLAIIDPVIQGAAVGSKSRAWRKGNDIVFATPDNKITSIGRILNKDTRPQAYDLAYNIRREIEDYDFGSLVGIEHINRTYIAVKSVNTATNNDRVLVYNKDYDAWEGYWPVSIDAFAIHGGDLYYGEAYTPNIYQTGTGINKTKGTTTYPMSCGWQSGFINTRGSGFYLNEVSSLAVEGYITSGTTINFNLYKDFANTAFQQLSLLGSETQFQDNVPEFSLLGGDPLGLEPLGVKAIIGAADEDGRRHFIAFLDFQMTQVEYISVEVSSSGKHQDWEIIALGLNATENVFESQEKIKTS